MAARRQAAKAAPKARKLKTSVHVHEWVSSDPENPDAEHRIVRTEVFEAGSELPEWAQAQVGDHVYEDEADDDADEQSEA